LSVRIVPIGAGAGRGGRPEGQARAKKHGTRLEIVTDLKEAVRGADFVQASTLIRSMLAGEQSPEEKEIDRPKWLMTMDVMRGAKPGAFYSHSGPAHRGICADDEIMERFSANIKQETLNAIHSKKALMALIVR